MTTESTSEQQALVNAARQESHIMARDEFIVAVQTAVREVLQEIYLDSKTRENLFVQLVQRYQQWVDDCQAEKQAAQSQLKILQHREVDMQSTIDQWRAAHERGEKKIEQLEGKINDLHIRIDQLEQARA
jgi:peptidoglycan hydrolase CwlO-like protein